MSEAYVVIMDVIALAGFSAALAQVLLAPAAERGPLGRNVARFFFTGAMSVYALVSLSNVLEHAGITAALDEVEDYGEILFIPFLLYSLYAMFMRIQVEDARRAERQMRRSQEFTQSVVDCTPAGILVLDTLGQITFANDSARRTLDLEEDAEGRVLSAPGARVLGLGEPDERLSLGSLVGDAELTNVPLFVEWPSGRRVSVIASTVPMYDASDRLAAVMVSFIETAESGAAGAGA